MCESVPRATALVAGTVEGGRVLARRIIVHEDAVVTNRGTLDAAAILAGQAISAKRSDVDYEVRAVGYDWYVYINGLLEANDELIINSRETMLLANAQQNDGGVSIRNTGNGISLTNTMATDVALDDYEIRLL